jgi:hypothetical protein
VHPPFHRSSHVDGGVTNVRKQRHTGSGTFELALASLFKNKSVTLTAARLTRADVGVATRRQKRHTVHGSLQLPSMSASLFKDNSVTPTAARFNSRWRHGLNKKSVTLTAASFSWRRRRRRGSKAKASH